jgi:hypothetical protein
MIIDEERPELTLHINHEILNHARLAMGIARVSHLTHTSFDEKIWQHLPSFHNYDHIRAVHKTMKDYFTFLRSNPSGPDPLDIRESVIRWNDAHPNLQITLDQLELAMSLAIQCHDLGNFMRSVEVSKDEKAIDGQELRYTFFSKYHSSKLQHLEGEQAEEAAEDRSIRIARFLLRHRDLLGTTAPTKALPAYLEPLVCHLIDETRYDFSAEKGGHRSPFSIAMRVFDQIGNYIHNINPVYLIGLMIELVLEDPWKIVNPYRFANFAFHRLQELLPDEATRNDLLKRYHVDFALPNQDYSGFHFKDEQIEIFDWLMQNLDQIKNVAGINIMTLVRRLERRRPDRFTPNAV